jgi:hypothetical protein
LLRNLLRCLARALATFALMLAGHDDGLAPVGAATPKVAGKWEGTWMHRAGSHGLWLYLLHTETEKSAILRWVVPAAAPWKADGTALRTH